MRAWKISELRDEEEVREKTRLSGLPLRVQRRFMFSPCCVVFSPVVLHYSVNWHQELHVSKKLS